MTNVVPIEIPPTTPWLYISFHQALNLRELDENTGDWHFNPMFYRNANQPEKKANLAGKGMTIDSTPSLGDFGVRDMAHILDHQGIKRKEGPVYVKAID